MKAYVYVDQYYDWSNHYFVTTDMEFVAEFNKKKQVRQTLLHKAIKKYGDYGGKPKDHRTRKIMQRLNRNNSQTGEFVEVELFEGRMTKKIMDDYCLSTENDCDC